MIPCLNPFFEGVVMLIVVILCVGMLYVVELGKHPIGWRKDLMGWLGQVRSQPIKEITSVISGLAY
jgi:hypothetical protein